MNSEQMLGETEVAPTAAHSGLKSIRNFCDLGGVRTADGQRLRAGRLFRAQALVQLPSEDERTVRALDFGMVCDLRALGERLEAANVWIDQSRTTTLEFEIDERLGALRAHQWQQRLVDPAYDDEKVRADVTESYRLMPTLLAQPLISVIEFCRSHDPRPILIHCTAGKDRTGFIVAMLLWALGVPRETILDNYFVSGRLYLDIQRIEVGMRYLFPDGVPPRALSAAKTLATVQRAYLEVTLAEIVKDYGSVEGYLRDVAGVNDATVEKLKHRFLE